MARVKGGTVSRARRKKVLKLAKGYFGSKHTLYKTANEQVMHSFKYAYNDRRKLKGNMRKIWITRINAAVRNYGMTYSEFMGKVNAKGIQLNRKVLADLAMNEPKAFEAIVNAVK